MQHSPQRAHGKHLHMPVDGSLGAMVGWLQMTIWNILKVRLPLWKVFFQSSKGSKDLSYFRVQGQEYSGVYQTTGKKVQKLRKQPSYTYQLGKAGQVTKLGHTSWAVRINYVTQGWQRVVLSKSYLLILLLFTTCKRNAKKAVTIFHLSDMQRSKSLTTVKNRYFHTLWI